MSIEWLRDVIICFSGLVVTGVLIVIAVVVYSFYRRVKAVLDSVEAASTNIKTTSATVQGIASCVGDEVVKPVAQVVAVIQGVRQGIDTISKLFKKEGGGDV